jgi:outer membrane receptor protein involved in Fe transport
MIGPTRDFFRLNRRLGIIAAFLIATATAGAQTSRVGGMLEGIVSDSSGGRIPKAEVHLRETDTHQLRTIVTDGTGFFRSNELPVGTYEVSVEVPGFSPYHHTGVTLQVGQTVHLDIVLQLAGITSEVTVTAQPPAIDTAQTSLTSTVDKERIEELPVISRNYLNFVLLAPGVAASSQQQSQRAQAALTDSGFTFGGLRARSNNLSIDGLDNNDEYTGSSRTELSLEIVQEFQVVNNGLSAEFGGASGGSINVVTKRGSNALHGDAFIFLQNGALNARDPFENESGKPELQKYRTGLALGGPIVKDRTFYYTSFEQEHNREQSESLIDPGVASVVDGALSSGVFPHLGVRHIDTEFFPAARAETEAAGRLDHQISLKHSLMLRYAFTNNREAGDAFNTGGLTDASARGSSFTDDHALVGSFASVFGPQAVGDLRFQIATRRVTLRTNDTQGPGIDIAGLLSFGRPYEGNGQRRENYYQLSYTYSRTRGRHLWKAGATANRVGLRAETLDGFGGIYLFGSLSDFLAGHPDLFRRTIGDATTNYAAISVGAFLQDHWLLAPRWTLDMGVRYDFEHLPSGFNEDTQNISPRLGLAYSPGAKWVLRAGYGVFFDRFVLANLNRAIQVNGVTASEQVAEGNAAAQVFRSSIVGTLGPVPAIAPSIYRADPHLAASYSQQASVAAEYLISTNLTAKISYLLVRGVKLARTRNINVFPPVVLTQQNAADLGIANPTPQQIGRPVFGPARQYSQFDNIYQLENSASSTYQGFSVSLNRRLADELEFSASYTLSKTFDDASDFNEQPQDPFNLRAERALSLQHQQQRFVFNALWDLPIGEAENGKGQARNLSLVDRIFSHIEMAPILTVSSGRPEDPLTGLDWNRAQAFPVSGRPLGFGRNSLTTPGLTTLDLRVLKYFPFGVPSRHLDLVVEFFNFFNRFNVTQINPVFGMNSMPLGGFMQPIAGAGPRQIQFSLDFEF